ncbi:MAG TPA: hypothetical protein PLH46_05525 [Caldisericia bacterium]|nr:hypothetical protein [Caldisericia bacterium]
MIFCPNKNSKEFKELVSSVGENRAYFLWNKYKGEVPKSVYSNIKEGVENIFVNNPELANAVYEALGFDNIITSTDKIVWGHPAIGKTTMLESNPDAFIDWDNKFNRKRDSWIANKSNTVIGTPEFKKARNEYMINYNNHKDYIAFVTEEWSKAKEKANKENKTLIASPHMLLNLFPIDFDKVITMNDKTFMDRAIKRSGGDEINSKLWKEGINETLKSVDKSKIIETDKFINDLFITPQQKQQAQQLYSQYLDTIFPDSKVKEIDNSLYISVLNQLEQEDKIEKDCTGGGKLKAEKGLQTSFTKNGKWKIIKDLKGYPTHKEGGVDLTIGKNGVSIKNGNTEFTAKHGLVIPKN